MARKMEKRNLTNNYHQRIYNHCVYIRIICIFSDHYYLGRPTHTYTHTIFATRKIRASLRSPGWNASAFFLVKSFPKTSINFDKMYKDIVSIVDVIYTVLYLFSATNTHTQEKGTKHRQIHLKLPNIVCVCLWVNVFEQNK